MVGVGWCEWECGGSVGDGGDWGCCEGVNGRDVGEGEGDVGLVWKCVGAVRGS